MSRNFLGQETSPYLLQHKDNPVHWRPWGEAALSEARTSNRPILLSVGYAACHWCHVMAHESFEDAEVAEVMNRLFVPVKVDREERPDIDTIYMNALHMLGEQGGWPLTMFLTPDGEPFWGGTYFPKEPKYGRPGFIPLMEEVSRLFHDEPEKIEQNRAALIKGLAAQAAHAHPGEPTPGILDTVADKFLTLMDPVHGGIKGAPKFPQTPLLTFLWRSHLRTGRADLREAATKALDHICEGGIYDHLGGGFARYAVDERWLAPHFEKMLYDNAQLLRLLASAWAETKKPLYARRARETVEWLFREMTVPGSGFAASLDADSEGEEGRFYVWSEAEVDAVLGADAMRFKQVYDVSANGNWEHTNILNRLSRADEPFSDDEEKSLEPLRRKLFSARAPRVRPGFDDKVLADWNGLMIAALAEAGATFGEPSWVEAAARAYAFVNASMVAGGRLHHAWRADKLQHRAMSDDLVNMLDAALALAEARDDKTFIADAERFAAELDGHYWDTDLGGYFFTADDAEALIVRTRSVADNATPAANGVAPGLLTKLALLTGNDKYLARADEIIRAFAGELTHNIFPLGSYLTSFEIRVSPIQIVLIGTAEGTSMLRRAALSLALPTRVVLRIADDAALPQTHPAFGKRALDGKPTAYVCVGETCSLPTTDPEELTALLLRARATT
ncbi:MAG: thioredoxin domain-containing protein [Parvibaculum sp.]|uniref:thioredoxin domain-containing protein n=1 Tax=Parvibaculum sp. TaxID=2024848 RepID=UPI0025D610DE|nr:thioredoxin domain-containing protein [Parvibaculum sp.]MCE9648065.1 thioredoxin domain-containing protein [Parvibaculum sp.]